MHSKVRLPLEGLLTNDRRHAVMREELLVVFQGEQVVSWDPAIRGKHQANVDKSDIPKHLVNAICIQADNPVRPSKVKPIGALGADGKREDAVTLLRAAAAQNDPQALYLIYEEHKSFGRSVERPQIVSRAEAEQSLRKAAELGHPEAPHILAVLLDRGGVVKKDPAGARFWAERALANAPRHSAAD